MEREERALRPGVDGPVRPGPLSDVVVLDLSRALAGPYAAMMLGDLGARVIKVERPGVGDDTRGWGPPFVGPPEQRESSYFLSINRNKESIVLDFKDPGDRDVLTRLVRRADVLVENFRPGVLDRLGFGHDRLLRLNPSLVVLSITGFGHDGPEAGRAGYDQILQGEAGLMSITGPDPEHPTKVGVPIADILAGMFGAYGVVAALHERRRTGRGQVVRTSLLAAVVGVHTFQGTRWLVAGEVPRAAGNRHPAIAPYGAFRCGDQFLQIAVGSDDLWRQFAPLVGIDPEDPRFRNNGDRVANREALETLISEALAGDSLERWLALFGERGIPAGEVKTLDRVYAWPQVLSQGLVVETEHPTLGRIRLPGPPLRFDAHPRLDHAAPPTLGQHDHQVLRWLETGGPRAGEAPPTPSPLPARDLIALVADSGSFEPWDEDVVSADVLGFVDRLPYPQRLAQAARRTGVSDAVVTGLAAIHGQPVALVAGEFGFMGGSVGFAAGERVARAFDRATDRGLPVVAMPSTGGTRMQEGTVGFVQMARAAQALLRHRRAGLPYVVYLAHPTFGGVLASWGSLGQVTFAMPGARIGFMGPRVVEATSGDCLPQDVQVAENLFRCGLVDDVVPPEDLRERVFRVLTVAGPRREVGAAPPPTEWGEAVPDGDAWESVRRSREGSRPGARELLAACATDITVLRGDGVGGGDDPGCLAALARVAGVPAVVVAQDRAAPEGARMGPSGYRKARRALAVARELGLPVVTVVDTPGPRVDREAEEGGLSAELARCVADLLSVPSPTLSILLGEGGGGAALALFPADRVVAAEHAWLAPISPEGASVIVFRTPERCADVARAQGISSWVLRRFGLVDVVVPEEPGPQGDPRAFLARVGEAVGRELRALLARDPADRLADRAARYRGAGGEWGRGEW